jgi:hypothetical protein
MPQAPTDLPYYLPMGTTVRVQGRSGYAGNVGRIFGRCNGTRLYNVEIEAPTYYGKPHPRDRVDINLYAGEFEVLELAQ